MGVLLLVKSTLLPAEPEGNRPGHKVVCNNFVYITGKSNINQFSFSYNTSGLGKGNSVKTGLNSDNIEINIPVHEFEASNPLMYNDFLSMLRASDFPIIKICFSKQQLINQANDSVLSDPDIAITIAGISKTYTIDCSVANCSDNIFISGIKTIKLTDFHLKPPVKLNGLVKVQDEINVNFGFIITFTSTNYLPITASH
jgi:hypothetical protein